MSLVDSHAHLDFEDFQGDVEGVVSRAAAVGVDRIVVVGLWRSPGSFGNALELARSRPGVFAVGDVRSGSTKRVASGVGEGSVVVAAIHRHLEAQRR